MAGGWRGVGLRLGLFALLFALLAPLAVQAVTYVGAGAASSSTGSNTRTLAIPAVAANDLLIAHVAIRGNRSITAPAGWNLIDSYVSTSGRLTQAVYYKVAVAGDSGSTATWTFNSSDDNAGIIRAYRTVDTFAPIGNVSRNTGDNSTLTALSLNTTVANEWITTFYGAADGNASPFSTPGGMTERYDFNNGGGGNGLSLAGDDQAIAAPGATGDRVTNDAQSDRFVAHMVAIKPPDLTAPTLVSITRAGTTPTNAATVSWTVTFSEQVLNVAAANFALVNGGLGGTPAITGVSGSGTTWTVTASTGTGSGTLALDMTGAGTIQDRSGNPLSGTWPVAGPAYTIDRVAPTVSMALAGSSPTTATSVSWTVDFSENVTGLSAANFTPVNGGLSGTPAITSVTGSGTAWTVTASAGDGTVSGTLGLNMINSTGVSDAAGNAVSNVPYTGPVYTINSSMTCLTQDFAGGVLDTTVWDVRNVYGGYTPQVVNAGGGDYRLRLTPNIDYRATFAQLKRSFPGAGNKIVLEIDYFAYGGTDAYPADGTVFTLSDSGVASTTGGYGGSLGYAQNTSGNGDGFGGGWLGVGLDEWGNYPCNNEGRTSYPAGWSDPRDGATTTCAGSGGNVRYVAARGSGSGTAGYYLLSKTAPLAAVAPASGAAGTTPYRYRFTVDHSDNVHAWVSVERDTTATGNNYATVLGPFDAKGTASQAAVPARWLVSFTSSTGGSNANHEFKRVKVCANTMSTSMTGFHHLRISHPSGEGVTCSPSTLTITACDNADCSSTYNGGVTGTLSAVSTSTVNWAGGTAFTIPAGSTSVNVQVQVTTPGTALLGATSADATNATTCTFGTPECTFTALDTGFIVSAPNHIAETSSALTIQAVRRSDSSLQCVPAFAGVSKNITLRCSYSDPGTGTLPVRVGGFALNSGRDAASACDAGGTTLSVPFDATGTATPSLQYADVGEVAVSASHSGTAGGIDAGLVMTGSGSFVTTPQRFELTGIAQAASPYRANPGAADDKGAAFIKAGENFKVTVTARNAADKVTPNYGQETAKESVKLVTALTAPVGGQNPALTGTGFDDFGTDCNGDPAPGVACGTFAWPEVGIITLEPHVKDEHYLTAGDVVGTKSGNVGRFFPATFAVVPTITPGCVPLAPKLPFTYAGLVGHPKQGQPFTINGDSITAQNTAYERTRNYTGGFMKLAVDGIAIAANPATGGATVPPTGGSVTITDGQGTFQRTGGFYNFTAEGVPQNIAITVTPTDDDGATGSADTAVSAFRFGRATIANANGSELTSLPVPLHTEYLSTDGITTFYVLNTDDSCTTFNRTTDLRLRAAGAAWVAGDQSVAVGGGTTQATGLATFIAGDGGLSLSAPGAGNTGYVDLQTNYSDADFPWLLYDWDQDLSHDDNPSGRASFGIYRGSPRHIYLRELVN
jgi:MSHA biogenesis protein MshQ